MAGAPNGEDALLRPARFLVAARAAKAASKRPASSACLVPRSSTVRCVSRRMIERVDTARLRIGVGVDDQLQTASAADSSRKVYISRIPAGIRHGAAGRGVARARMPCAPDGALRRCPCRLRKAKQASPPPQRIRGRCGSPRPRGCRSDRRSPLRAETPQASSAVAMAGAASRMSNAIRSAHPQGRGRGSQPVGRRERVDEAANAVDPDQVARRSRTLHITRAPLGIEAVGQRQISVEGVAGPNRGPTRG